MKNGKTMYNLTYGVFVLASKAEGKTSGCIINTGVQVTTNPNRIIICVNKSNYTHELVEKSGVFTLSILDESAPFGLFKQFGFQSGRTVDKFQNLDTKLDENGIPYLTRSTCGYLSCKVVSASDLGSHTLFLADVLDGDVLSDKQAMTYSYYQTRVKEAPKPVEKKTKGWVCRICGYIYEGEVLPSDFVCPICGHGPEDFEKLE